MSKDESEINREDSLSLSVIALTFNQLELTKRFLDSLLEGSDNPHELIIVDNNSSDGTLKYLYDFSSKAEERGWKFSIIENDKNMGISVGWNQAIKASSGDFIGIANNDTWFMNGWDSLMLRRIEELSASMIGPYYYEGSFDEDEMRQRAEKFVETNKGKYAQRWCSIFMLFRKDVFEKIGLFDERFFAYYEDKDYEERMKKAGLLYYTIADCFIWHFSSATLRNKKDLPSDFEQKSRKKFIEKWGFDVNEKEKRFLEKLSRSWRKFKHQRGYF